MGQNQSEIAKKQGFSRSQWTNYENSVSFPKFFDLVKIAKYFDVTESDLIHLKISEDYFKNSNKDETERLELLEENRLLRIKIDELTAKLRADKKQTQRNTG